MKLFSINLESLTLYIIHSFEPFLLVVILVLEVRHDESYHAILMLSFAIKYHLIYGNMFEIKLVKNAMLILLYHSVSHHIIQHRRMNWRYAPNAYIQCHPSSHQIRNETWITKITTHYIHFWNTLNNMSYTFIWKKHNMKYTIFKQLACHIFTSENTLHMRELILEST